MSQGLVPVSYRVGVAPEVIKNGENGYLVETREEARDRIEELLADEPRRLAMAAAARESARAFRSDTIAERLIEVYRKVREESQSGHGANIATPKP